MAQLVKNPHVTRETWVQSLGWEDPLEKEKTIHSKYSGLENSMDCIVQGVAKTGHDRATSLTQYVPTTQCGILQRGGGESLFS